MKRLLVIGLVGAAALAGFVFAPGGGPEDADLLVSANRNGPPASSPPSSTPGSGVACNVNAADVGYTASFSHTRDLFEVTVAHVHVSPGACAGSTLTVAFTDESGAEIGSGSALIETADVTVPMTVRPAAEFVTGVQVAIEAGRGANPPTGGASGR